MEVKEWEQIDKAISRDGESGRKGYIIIRRKQISRGYYQKSKGNFIMMKWSIHQEVVIIINLCLYLLTRFQIHDEKSDRSKGLNGHIQNPRWRFYHSSFSN